VKTYRINLSSSVYSQSAPKERSKIANLDEVLEQLLESFKLSQKHSWSNDIYRRFKLHFAHCF
jgi:hypothetical protein